MSTRGCDVSFSLKIEMEKSTTPTSDTSPSFLVIKRESESSAPRLEKE